MTYVKIDSWKHISAIFSSVAQSKLLGSPTLLGLAARFKLFGQTARSSCSVKAARHKLLGLSCSVQVARSKLPRSKLPRLSPSVKLLGPSPSVQVPRSKILGPSPSVQVPRYGVRKHCYGSLGAAETLLRGSLVSQNRWAGVAPAHLWLASSLSSARLGNADSAWFSSALRASLCLAWARLSYYVLFDSVLDVIVRSVCSKQLFKVTG